MSRALLVLAASLLLAVACGSEKAPVPPRPSPTPTLNAAVPPGSRQVIDMVGRSISVPDRVEKVVAISPSAVDFANALGLTVVGRPSDVQGSQAPAVGSTLSPDFNAIAALSPDLVLADSAFHGSRLRDFDKFPYPVFVIRTGSYDDVLAALTALGAATGRDAQARDTAASIQQRVDAVLAKARAAKAPSVLIVTGSGREVYGGSDATYAGSLVTRIGATNVLGALPGGAPIAGFGTVELNQLAAKNPDAVLAIPSGTGTLAADLRASPAWAGSNAVKNKRVFELDPTLYLRSPGPRVAEALEHLYDLLYK